MDGLDNEWEKGWKNNKMLKHSNNIELVFFNICNRLYESLYNNTQSQYCVMWSITKRMFKMYIKPNNFILRPWSFWNGLVLISEPFYQYLYHIISIICLIRWTCISYHQIHELSIKLYLYLYDLFQSLPFYRLYEW